MRDHILILGGYGNFGKRIAINLSKADIPITIAGRNRTKAEKLTKSLEENSDIAIFDVHTGLQQYLDEHRPTIVIKPVTFSDTPTIRLPKLAPKKACIIRPG